MGSFTDHLRQAGRRIRALRRQRRWNQKDLAHAAGISRTFMGTIETGTKQASLWTYFRIAGAMKVAVAELFIPEGSADRRDLLARIHARLAAPSLSDQQLKKIDQLVAAFLEEPRR